MVGSSSAVVSCSSFSSSSCPSPSFVSPFAVAVKTQPSLPEESRKGEGMIFDTLSHRCPREGVTVNAH
eukprot:7458959-Prorocentrum_lima.AAC.1